LLLHFFLSWHFFVFVSVLILFACLCVTTVVYLVRIKITVIIAAFLLTFNLAFNFLGLYTRGYKIIEIIIIVIISIRIL